jgi:hypothetical protein
MANPAGAGMKAEVGEGRTETGPTIDTDAEDNGGEASTGRVEGIGGTLQYSQRQEVDTDRYNMPVFTSPCRAPAGTGTVGTQPRIQEARVDRDEDVQFQLAGSIGGNSGDDAPQINTLDYDPNNPPDVYFAVCRVNQTDPTDPEVQDEVLDWLKLYFSRTMLPTPRPEISAQNGGICGVVHTVDLHMPTELLHRDMATPFGALSLHIYGRVIMNWGDGKREVHLTGGGPYPNSSIKHSWTDRGNYDIEAHADWIANYTLGPYNGVTYSGVLTGISTEGSIENFKVWEAQAMLIK